MKFFVPATDNEKEAETLYKEIRQFARKNTSPLTDRRIQIISFRDKGRLVSAEVGKIDPIVGETVVAILETIEPGPYLVCTPNRGVK